MTWLSESTGGWPSGVAARRDMALLAMGFARASRRSDLAGVKALPYGRDPVTCPPCAFVRWREVLHAADTAEPGRQRLAVMRVLRRQAAAGITSGGG